MRRGGVDTVTTQTWTPEYTPVVPAPKPVWVISTRRRGRRDRFEICTSDPKTAQAEIDKGNAVERLR